MREMTDNEPRLARTETMQVIKHALAIVERAERVNNHDIIERAGQGFNKAGCFNVARIESIGGVGPPRFLNCRHTQIDTDTKRRLERR